MNQQRYRIVFNKRRGALVAVAETARAWGKAAGQTTAPHRARRTFAVQALSFNIWTALGLVFMVNTAHAQIVADPNAPANQRPTVLTAPNGVPLVNIQTPSAAGVSRNTYQRFDVQTQGAILNNSRTTTATQLGGWVQGNPWLATGGARVILNEVNSSNPSQLRGYVEVAGQRAQVIIANPAGISCEGCGFINAGRATLTTGTPVWSGGAIEGYRVQGGTVRIGGAGLDASGTDYTDLIARAVEVNAGLWAQHLTVVTGTQQVNVNNELGTPSVGTALAAVGATPQFAVDVAALGGMYAGKISLIGTETGVGVRNAGQMGAAAGEVSISIEGLIENSGRISASGALRMDTTAGLTNTSTGTVYAQGDATVSTRGQINNAGVIAAAGHTTVSATGAASNLNSGSDALLAAGLASDGRLNTSGTLSLSATQSIHALGQNLSGGDQTLSAQTVNLSGSQTSARALTLTASSGDVDLSTSSVVVSERLNVNAHQTLRTDGAAVLAAELQLNALNISNRAGLITQSGSGTAQLSAQTIDNTGGRLIASNGSVQIDAHTLTNTGGQLQAAQDMNVQATHQLINLQGLMRAGRALNASADGLDNRNTLGTDLGLEAQSLNLTARQIDNTQGALRADQVLTLESNGSINNTAGLISSAGHLTVREATTGRNTLAVTNTNGTLVAGQTLNIQSAALTGDGGLFSLGDLSLQLTQNFTLAGELKALGSASVHTAATFTNQSDVQTGGLLRVRAAQMRNDTYGVLSGGQLDVAVTGTLTNFGLLDGQDALIQAHTLNNLTTGRIYGDRLSIAADTLVNVGEPKDTPVGTPSTSPSPTPVFALSVSSSAARSVTTHAFKGPGKDRVSGGPYVAPAIVARERLDIGARSLRNENHALILSAGDIAIGRSLDANHRATGQGQSLKNASATIEALGNLDLAAAQIDNLHPLAAVSTPTTVHPPGQILAAGNMRLRFDVANNDASHIIAGGNIDTEGRSISSTNGAIEQRNTAYTATGNAKYLDPSLITEVKERAQSASGVNTVIRSIDITPSVPASSLFSAKPAPTATYLIETDPRFANYRQWLSSDYLLTALALDPATALKRLGDGFYEQKLIREQIAQLTGRRFLEGYANDEAQYAALMSNAATFARAHQLRPGVALTAAQMAALTSDIVWLVEKSVTLRDGTTTKALVPQVYVRVREGDLRGDGAFISGNAVNFNLSGELRNSGTIAGRQVVAINADTVRNLGRISAENVGVQTRGDIESSGTLEATQSLVVNAGRDLNLTSNTRTQGSTTSIDRVAGLYVSGSQATLLASAARDMNLTGAVIRNDSNGNTVLVAARDLNLATVQLATSGRSGDNRNWSAQSLRTEVGTQIQTQGDLLLHAGGDLIARAANLTSDQGALTLSAGRDVRLTAGEQQRITESFSTNQSRRLFRKKTTTTYSKVEETTALATTVSAHSTTVLAGGDIQVLGSNLVSTGDTVLKAQKNIDIAATQQSLVESNLTTKTTSGFFRGGGIGITFGKQVQSTDQKTTTLSAAASTVGSIEGSVLIDAGKTYTQTGSHLLAPTGDLSITAQTIHIQEAREKSQTDIETRFRQSGLTLALTSPIISALQTADQMRKAAKDTDSSRMKLLAAANTGFAGYNAYDAVQKGQGQTVNGKDNQIVTKVDENGKPTEGRDATAKDKAGGVSLSISIGASSSKSNSTNKADNAAASTLNAGRNISLTATGAGQDSNLTIQGSTLKAANDIALTADNQINLLAARNTAEQKSTNSSMSGSVGFSIGSNTGFTVSASGARGKADGNDETWSNTKVEAGNQLTLKSGGDTTLKGAVASGHRVSADIGGNLLIESLQDKSIYDSKQQSLGASITIGPTMGGSLSYSKSKANSTYASVIEQSGIQAGDGGFDIKVGGNTTLIGGLMGSTDAAIAAGVNRLETATLITTDIHNYAQASASSSGFSASSAMMSQGSYGIGNAALGNVLTQGKQGGSSMGDTRSAISAGTVVITNETAQKALTGKNAQQTVANLNRDTHGAHIAAQRLDVQKMQRTAQAEHAIKQETHRQLTVHSDVAYKAMFKTAAKFFKVTCAVATENCLSDPKLVRIEQISQEEAKRDGKILAVNGILNDANRAGQLAYQNVPDDPQTLTKPESLTLMYIPKADTVLGELFVGAYEKVFAPLLGYTNADNSYADVLQGRGNQDTLSLGHSRGTIVQRNAFNIAADRGYTNDRLSVHGVGGAVGFGEYARTASRVTKPENIGNVTFTYMANDPVSVIAAGNPGDAVAALREFFNVVTKDNSAHSCYGTGAPGCATIANPVPGGPVPTQQNPNLIRVYRGFDLAPSKP